MYWFLIYRLQTIYSLYFIIFSISDSKLFVLFFNLIKLSSFFLIIICAPAVLLNNPPPFEFFLINFVLKFQLYPSFQTIQLPINPKFNRYNKQLTCLMKCRNFCAVIYYFWPTAPVLNQFWVQ